MIVDHWEPLIANIQNQEDQVKSQEYSLSGVMPYGNGGLLDWKDVSASASASQSELRALYIPMNTSVQEINRYISTLTHNAKDTLNTDSTDSLLNQPDLEPDQSSSFGFQPSDSDNDIYTNTNAGAIADTKPDQSIVDRGESNSVNSIGGSGDKPMKVKTGRKLGK